MIRCSEKTTEKDQGAEADAAKETSIDAAATPVLSELDGIFILKEE